MVDLRGLQNTDDAGKQWLLSMAHEGAKYLPESYFRDGLACPDQSGKSCKIGIVSRLLSIFRGRPIPDAAESTTRVR